jgi:hypothetical protein
MKIAMWSGPRNLSTAMMYAFGARADFAVWDEPFYAAYLARTGAMHPLFKDVIAKGEPDPVKVAARCSGPIPEGKSHFYMKHMPHHMCADFPLNWAVKCANVHLIRHPARVISSYAAKREQVTFDDIGFRQQFDLYDKIGGVIVDSADIRDDPHGMLKALCAAIDLPFDPAMLHWPAGGHKDDGPWASHWYCAIHKSTGFAGPEGPLPDLTVSEAEICAKAMPFYDKLAQQKLSV